MTPGENKQVTTGIFPWKTGMATILLIVSVVYFVKFINAPPNEEYKKPGKTTSAAVAIAVTTATQGDFPVYLNGLGNVTPLRTVTVRSRVDGALISVVFKEGQMVHEGDLLAQIDPRAFQAQVMQYEGQLLRDDALLKNAEIDLVRYQTLSAQDSIASQQTVTQEWLVKQDKGTVEIDRGLLATAKLQLDYARITAPITGRMGLRLLDQGNMVHATDANGLAVITQIQPIAVVFTLPEDNLPAVMKLFLSDKTLAIDAYDRKGKNKLAEGQVTAVDNQIDTTTGTVKLKGQFANQDQTLFANQFVNIKLKMDILHSVTIIPTAAIQKGSAGTFVYVLNEDQTVSIRTLTLGPTEGEKIAVLEGLKPNEQVVVDGADKLRDNMKVKVISSKPGSAADAPPPPLSNQKTHQRKDKNNGNNG